MKLSNTLKKRFCKDFALPIGIFDDEYFYYFIDLYDEMFDTRNKLKMLIDCVTSLGGEDAFMQEFNRIKNDIIDDVSATEGYNTLSSTKDPYPYDAINQYPGQNIYVSQFDGKSFLSIDIVKANFFSMKKYDPTILDNANNWKEFLSKYSDHEYYHKSKQLRQVIFGNLLPKRQQALQKNVCNEIADTIKALYPTLDIAIVSTDEVIVLNHTRPENIINEVRDELNKVLGYTTDDLRVEAFGLEKVHPEKSYFVKHDLVNGNMVFKSVPQLFFAQVYKRQRYNFIKMNEADMSFMHEGMIATFNTPIYKDEY